MKPITLSTAGSTADSGNDPAVSISITPAVPAGKTLRFSLTVLDANGIQSQPFFVDVPVVPLPVATFAGPGAVATGSAITFDASNSTPKGQIVTFKWTLISVVPTS
jgi:hypothetical protein